MYCLFFNGQVGDVPMLCLDSMGTIWDGMVSLQESMVKEVLLCTGAKHHHEELLLLGDRLKKYKC